MGSSESSASGDSDNPNHSGPVPNKTVVKKQLSSDVLGQGGNSGTGGQCQSNDDRGGIPSITVKGGAGYTEKPQSNGPGSPRSNSNPRPGLSPQEKIKHCSRKGCNETQDNDEPDAQYLRTRRSSQLNGNAPFGYVPFEDFEKIKFIGSGSFAKVYLVRQKSTGKLFAMKDIKKTDLSDKKEIEHLVSEREILMRITNPFIVRMHYWFNMPESLYFILDYADGGELFSHLRQVRRFNIDQVRLYAAELTLALSYLHDSGIIYRDLKPENILLTGRGHIKLTDFGLSKIFDAHKIGMMNGPQALTPNAPNLSQGAANEQTANAQTFCGTAEYMAPEILAGKGHGRGVDWWALGVLVYEMIVGVAPFYSPDRRKMFKRIMKAKIIWPDEVPKQQTSPRNHNSASTGSQVGSGQTPTPGSFRALLASFPPIKIPAVAKDFIIKLLTKDRKLRLGSIDQGGSTSVTKHPFYTGLDWSKVANKVYKPVYIPQPTEEEHKKDKLAMKRREKERQQIKKRKEKERKSRMSEQIERIRLHNETNPEEKIVAEEHLSSDSDSSCSEDYGENERDQSDSYVVQLKHLRNSINLPQLENAGDQPSSVLANQESAVRRTPSQEDIGLNQPQNKEQDKGTSQATSVNEATVTSPDTKATVVDDGKDFVPEKPARQLKTTSSGNLSDEMMFASDDSDDSDKQDETSDSSNENVVENTDDSNDDDGYGNYICGGSSSTTSTSDDVITRSGSYSDSESDSDGRESNNRKGQAVRDRRYEGTNIRGDSINGSDRKYCRNVCESKESNQRNNNPMIAVADKLRLDLGGDKQPNKKGSNGLAAGQEEDIYEGGGESRRETVIKRTESMNGKPEQGAESEEVEEDYEEQYEEVIEEIEEYEEVEEIEEIEEYEEYEEES